MCRGYSISRGEFRATVIWQHQADFKCPLGAIVPQIREVFSCTMLCACVTWCHVQNCFPAWCFRFFSDREALQRDSFAPAVEIHQKSRPNKESTRENSVQSQNRNVEMMKWIVYVQADTLRYVALQITRLTRTRIVISTQLPQPKICNSIGKMWI